jgi:cellulose synthase/poly-beta-1,6-N-acetylglucosamine synthase-like glycosyltransferase
MIGSAVTYTLLFISLYFEIFLLVAFLERHFGRRVAQTTVPVSYPSVAIAVPCFNEEKTIRGTLSSLLALDYPKDKLEIIVVDDGSSDSTLAIAQNFAAQQQGRKIFSG